MSNTIIIAGQIVTGFQVRTEGQKETPVVECFIAFTYEDQDGVQFRKLKLEAWNGNGAKLQKFQPQDHIVIEGTLDMDVVERDGTKEKRPTVRVSNVHAGNPGLLLNVVTLTGNTGENAELKYFESGSVKGRQTLAVRKSKTETNWFNLEMWGNNAETASRYAPKGKQIAVKGSLLIDQWEDKSTGAERRSPKVKVSQLTLLNGGRREVDDNDAAAVMNNEEF